MGAHIDGAGLAKLETLDSAITLWQRLHGIVERMAGAQRLEQSLVPFRQQIQRAATPLASLLKPQFGPISDMVTAMVIVTTRGGSEGARVRALRENVGQIRNHLDAAVTRVRKQHTVDERAE